MPRSVPRTPNATPRSSPRRPGRKARSRRSRPASRSRSGAPNRRRLHSKPTSSRPRSGTSGRGRPRRRREAGDDSARGRFGGGRPPVRRRRRGPHRAACRSRRHQGPGRGDGSCREAGRRDRPYLDRRGRRRLVRLGGVDPRDQPVDHRRSDRDARGLRCRHQRHAQFRRAPAHRGRARLRRTDREDRRRAQRHRIGPGRLPGGSGCPKDARADHCTGVRCAHRCVASRPSGGPPGPRTRPCPDTMAPTGGRGCWMW